MIKLKYILLCTFLVIISGCKKEELLEEFIITLKDTSPNNLQEFQENVMVILEYEHPEGFVGFANPDYLSLEIHDSRLPNPDLYHLQPLSPPNHTISIKGKINIAIDAPFCFGNGNSETLTYSLRIQDNQMRWSNTVTTPTITVNK